VADRLCPQGILYVLHQDIAWQLLPLELGFGSGQSCWRRLGRWQQAGVFDGLHRVLLAKQTFALLHQFKRLAVRWERRLELRDAFISLACSLICWRRLKKAHS
jgi:transposase